uniref:Uncharacterized protein n=1 Tax=Triticum urartu TaxID=4572 RepID=A0A8R7JVZ7_TRIUA
MGSRRLRKILLWENAKREKGCKQKSAGLEFKHDLRPNKEKMQEAGGKMTFPVTRSLVFTKMQLAYLLPQCWACYFN